MLKPGNNKYSSKEQTPEDLKNAVHRDKLTDTPARFFRSIAIDKLGINLAIWKTYLDDYIRIKHPDVIDDMERVKRERSTTIGNITDTFWQRPSLTFKKLLIGLKILKATKVKITVEAEFNSGKKVIVSEEFHLDINKED